MSDILDSIHGPNDIKQISEAEYAQLAKEIRAFLINSISKTGGHLSSNLGVVELTMALHLSLNLPKDKIIWDVGHQSYVHKMLTGRKDGFAELRQFGGMSGFPKMSESECDAFDTGHSSTSISAAMGYVKARDLLHSDETIVAVIGDGALSGGMAYEALNNAGRLKSNLIIILNDNNMSISENVGGMANYLGQIRTNNKYVDFKGNIESTLENIPVIGTPLIGKLKKSKDSIKRLVIQGMLFEDMGLTYIGPIDGHNVKEMKRAIENAKKAKKAVLIHVVTQKGKGYKKAEKEPSRFHGIEPFSVKTGICLKQKSCKSYSEVFSDTIVDIAKDNPGVVAITAAMPQGTGLSRFETMYPERFFDVGIAESHAVTFAAGLAAGGFHPVFAVYSTFLQRAYDQIIHDVCINRFPVTFAIDRAGLVGSDGETHQGVFDLSYLSTMPNMTIMAPKNADELEQMLRFAITYDGPVAIRYPRGSAFTGLNENRQPIEYGKAEVLCREQEILLIAVGSMVETAWEVKQHLAEIDLPATLINARFVKPFDYETLKECLPGHRLVVTLEENVKAGGFGESIAQYLSECSNEIPEGTYKHLGISLPDTFIEQGDVSILKMKYGLDADSIVKKIVQNLL